MEKIKEICKITSKNVSLSEYTTLGIGGRAKYLACPHEESELVGLLSYLDESNIKYCVLGQGSNILVSDKGYDGVVVLTRGIKNISVKDDKVHATCGVTLPALSRMMLEYSLSGVECLSGIPASIGGALITNAGAYGGEISSIVDSVRIYENGKIITYKNRDLGFGYRTSLVERLGIVLSANLRLKYENSSIIKAKIEEFAKKRSQTQPKNKSAGCVFKAYNGLSSGYCIDKAGLKGKRIGGAEVSSLHAGFVINRGGATSSDFVKLLLEIQEEVEKKFGFLLSTEIRFVGEYDEDIRRLSHPYGI